MVKKKTIVSTLIVFLAAALLPGVYLLLVMSGKKAAVKSADNYIQAVQHKNFDVIYDLNAVPQKKVFFILKSADSNKEGLLKQDNEAMKSSFDNAQPSWDLKGLWAEKFIFIPSMKYKITDVEMERDIDNPTAVYRKRINVYVTVAIEYAEKDTAPVHEEKNIRNAAYIIKMIHSRNITKAIRGPSLEDKWLFKSMAIKQDSVVYW